MKPGAKKLLATAVLFSSAVCSLFGSLWLYIKEPADIDIDRTLLLTCPNSMGTYFDPKHMPPDLALSEPALCHELIRAVEHFSSDRVAASLYLFALFITLAWVAVFINRNWRAKGENFADVGEPHTEKHDATVG